MNTNKIGITVGSADVELTAHWVQGDSLDDMAIAAINWDVELYSDEVNSLINRFIDLRFDSIVSLLQEFKPKSIEIDGVK